VRPAREESHCGEQGVISSRSLTLEQLRAGRAVLGTIREVKDVRKRTFRGNPACTCCVRPLEVEGGVTKTLAALNSLLAPRNLGRLGSAVCLVAGACSLEVPGSASRFTRDDAGAEVGGQAPIDPQRPTDAASLMQDAGEQRDAEADVSAPGKIEEEEDAGSDTATACSLQGRFALHFVVDVTWSSTTVFAVLPGIQAGEGQLGFVMLLDAAPSAAGFEAELRMCSAVVPESVRSLSGERYQLRFDDDAWDSDTMPVFSTSFNAPCREPGCRISGGPMVALIGAELDAPDAPWPSDPRLGSWPDHDDDGALGLTGRFLGPDDGDFTYPPLNLLSITRMRELWLGLRLSVAFGGTFSSCDELGGPLTRGSVETRALGCTVGDDLNCSIAEVQALNENLPVWNAQQGSYEARRVPAKADCDDARRMFER